MARWFPSARRPVAALVAVPLLLLGLAVASPPASAAGVAATEVAAGLNRPGGVVSLGTGADRTLWVSDDTSGFCRLDPAPGGGRTIAPASCVAAGPAATVRAVAGSVYDPDGHAVYLADDAANSTGVWRLTYDPVGHTVGAPVNVVPAARVAARAPAALALGTDGNLYVGYRADGSVERVVAPSGPTPAVQPVVPATAGGLRGIAFVGTSLYVARPGGILAVPAAAACADCAGSPVTGLTAGAPTALTSDSAGTLYWAEPAAGGAQVQRFDLVTGTEAPVTSTGVPLTGGAAVPIVEVTALGLDDTGALFIGDAGPGGNGRLWSITTNTPLQPPFAQPAPSTPDLATGSDTGRSATDNVTRLTTPVVTGAATPAALVQVMEGAVVRGSATADSAGVYRVTVAGLGSGRHTLTALASRGVRTSVRSAGLRVTVDTAAPHLRVAARPRPVTFDHTPSVRWTSEAGTRAACSLQPVTSAPLFAGCRSPFTGRPLADGTYRLLVRVVDVAGNARLAAPIDFQLRSARSLRGKPRVVERSPRIGATGVDRLADIDVRFSERVRHVTRSTVHLTDAGGRRVPVRLQFDAQGAVATLDPVRSLPKDRTFVVTVRKTVTDVGGHPMARAQQWRFTTGPRPIVSAVRPFVDSTGVPRIANVTVIFNEGVRDVSTRTLRLVDDVTRRPVPLRVRIVDSDLALMDPVGKLAAGRRYTAVVSSGVRDRAGNHLIGKTWSFTTKG